MSRLHLFRDAVRAKEIVTILFKYRFDEFLEKIDTPAVWLRKIAPPIKGSWSLPQRMRMAVEELGPTFIKIAQMLSTRPDILPQNWIEEFEQLQDKVKPSSFVEMRQVLEKELGGTIEECFDEFISEPVASGSIGQIYRAKRRGSGEWVAVKIQRPRLQQPMQTDFEIISWLVNHLEENFQKLRPFDLPTVVKELKQGVLTELDFTVEARNAQVFNSLNRFPERVFAPEVYPELSSRKVLVTEWIDGKSPADLNKANPQGLGPEIAEAGGSSFFSQIAETGFFHGDPHPGNLLVTADQRICFVDWGVAGQLTRRMRYALMDLFSACAKRDAEMVTRIALMLGSGTRRIDRLALEKAITTTLFKHDTELRRMENLGQVIFELIFMFGSHGIHVARDYTLLAKAVISIEKTSHLLDPNFNLAKIGEPFVKELNWERWNPSQISRSTFGDLKEKMMTLGELPRDIQRIMHRIEDEDLGLVLEHRGFEQASDTVHHAFSRLSLAVIIGSLIIGSSVVINTGVTPLLWGYPAIGIIGYLLSAAIAAYVTFDILRGNRLWNRKIKKKK